MKYTSVVDKINKVVNSCVNYNQVLMAKDYCYKLVLKFPCEDWLDQEYRFSYIDKQCKNKYKELHNV